MSHASSDSKRKGFGAALKERGMAFGMKLMNDPKNQERVLQAMDRFQRGKAQLAAFAEEALHASSLPSQKDLKGLGKKLSHLRKEAAEIKRRLEELETK